MNDHCDSSEKTAQKDGTRGNVVVSASFWPPLEVRSSSTLSWTSVTPRLLNGPDKDNLKLILLLFPFKMHIKLTELHKSCLSKFNDDSICDVVASHSTSMLHVSGSLNRMSLMHTHARTHTNKYYKYSIIY